MTDCECTQFSPFPLREGGRGVRFARIASLLTVIVAICLCSAGFAANNPEPPPDPGFVNSILACDCIVDADILNGGPFRAVAQTRKTLKGEAPKIFELEGFNSYNWDTVHQGLSSGSRYILFLSKTDRPDVFATLTPAAPRLSVTADGVLLELGDPPFRIPVKPKALEEGIKLILEQTASGKTPERAEAFIHELWDDGEIESRYLAVALTGALRDRRLSQLLSDASKDKILKMRLTAIEALGFVGSPESINTLCILLKDDKATVSREAARALSGMRRADTLPELLEWVRRGAAARSIAPGPNGKPADANKLKAEALALEILKLTAECGPLLEPETIARPLFDIVRGGNDTLTHAAYGAIGEIARGPQIAALIELAEDRTYDQRAQAVDCLQKITLKTYKDSGGFRSWWSDAGTGFNDDVLRDIAESAAAGLAKKEPDDDRRAMRDLLRKAPGEIALAAVAPLMFAPDTDTEFGSDDLIGWSSPLAAPLLIERLGKTTLSDRRGAVDGLTRLCIRNPRLRLTLWPLLRATLADEDSSCRRLAHAAVGALAETDGIPALIDSIQEQYQYPRFEKYDSYRALYNCSARTMGFATNEPPADQIAAQKRFRGWWESAKDSFVPRAFNAAPLPGIQWADGDAATRASRLEALTLGNASRPGAAAFAVLFAERPAGDAFWAKLLAQTSQRDRAHGLLALYGGNATALAELSRQLSEDSKDGALCRAIAILGLATIRGSNGTAPGAQKIVDWLKGPGARADLGWKRLAIVSLGLCDGDNASLACLTEALDAALAAKVPDRKLHPPIDDDTPPSDDYLLLKPIVVALSARKDGADGVLKALKETKSADIRMSAARSLSLRRQADAAGPILMAADTTDRSSWSDYARIAAPLLRPADASAVCDLFASENSWARAAAAFLLAIRPDVGTDEPTIKELIAALSDRAPTVRYYAAEALGKRKALKALRALVEALSDDDTIVRAAAAEALGRIGDKDACRVAIRAAARELQPPGPEWYNAMAIAGGDIFFQQFLKLCNSNLYSDQQQGLDAMTVLNNQAALDHLLKIYRDDEAQMQTQAFDALARRGGSVLEALGADLKAPDKNVRARAVHLLGRIDTRASRELLVRVSDDTNEDAGLRALADFGLQRLRK